MVRRWLGAIALALVFSFAFGVSASMAQSCGDDLQKFSQRRAESLTAINSLVAASKGKQLDPTVFCARSQPLNAVETQMIAYMEKNKDWCQIPDDVINQLKATHAKSVSFANKACNVAAQMKKMKQQAESGQGPQAQPLPAGPL